MSDAPSPDLGPSPLAAGENNLSVEAARAAIAATLVPMGRGECEAVPLAAAEGRILAADLISPIDVPAHDNSAMDGFAFDGATLSASDAVALRVQGTVYAGAPFEGEVGNGACLRIMTGAVMPAGADTVVPLELAQAEGDTVRIAAGVIRRGENRRRRGEDLARGGVALAAGRVLTPADIGLAASLGFTELQVMRRLRVALFSTGDEVAEPGTPLAAGHIYDSNRYSLGAALRRLGFEVVDLGLVRDDRAALAAAVQRALRSADAIVTSGGVSAGDADYTRDVLAAHGEVAFWKVAMRPGRPFAFGPLRRMPGPAAGSDAMAPGASSWLFGLPGNPVAALVTFYAFVREALLVLAGAAPRPLPVLKARCTVAIRKRPGRTEFQRAIVEAAPDGSGWQVRPFGSQGAGVLRSMSEANALLVLGHAHGSVAAGEEVPVWLFDGLA